MANSYFYHNMVRTYQLPNTGSIESKVRKNEWASETSISWADLIYPTRISLQIWVPLIFASQFHFSILIAKWNYSFYNTKWPTSDGAMAFGWIHILEEQVQAISGGLTFFIKWKQTDTFLYCIETANVPSDKNNCIYKLHNVLWLSISTRALALKTAWKVLQICKF